MYNRTIRDVPYYRDRDEYPLYNGNVPCYEFVRHLPILQKNTLRDNNQLFVSFARRRWCTSHTTSGTTGTPLTLFATPIERGLRDAVTRNWYKKITGCNGKRPSIILSGFMTPVKRTSFTGRHLVAMRYF